MRQDGDGRSAQVDEALNMFGIDWEGNDVEAKFKVGDRVQFTDKVDTHWWFKVGETGVVKDNGADGFCYTIRTDKPNDSGWTEAYVNENHIELAPAAPKFKMGDRVRVIDGDYADKVFQITDVDDDMGLTYYWVLPHGYCFQESRLELAPDCAERKVEQDNAPAMDSKPQPKFKAGDVVRCVAAGFTDFTNGKTYTVEEAIDEYGYVGIVADDVGEPNGLCPEYFELVSSSKPHIVALVKSGKPLPSRYPHIHDNVEAATAEAERLARNNPGQEFAVYQRVAGRVAEVQVNMKEVA